MRIRVPFLFWTLLERFVRSPDEVEAISSEPRTIMAAGDRRHNDVFMVSLDPEALFDDLEFI